MMGRRTFLSYAVGMVGIVTGPLAAQKAILEGREAVVCPNDSVKCPNGHQTCKSIDAPIMIGNDNRNYPDSAQLFDFHLLRCEVCKVLFTKE